MIRRYNDSRFLLFVMGLFSATQINVMGAIAISEFVIFIVAPFVWFSKQQLFRRDRCNCFVFLCCLALVGCVLSSAYNHINLILALKGFATPYGFLASFIVFFTILRKSPQSFGWYLLGAAFSAVLCTFVFSGGYEAFEAESRGGGAEAIMSGPIYWIGRLAAFQTWFVSTFYLKLPVAVSVLTPLAFSFFALLTTVSGRSAALISMSGSALIAVGRKSQKKMISIRKQILFYSICGLLALSVFKAAYSYAAENGILGEAAKAKYQSQTRGGKDVLHLLMGGRGAAFLGLYYCYKHPIMGYGPWAHDYEGIYAEFYGKFGLDDDYESLMKSMAKHGLKTPLVGAHSAILQFWLGYGILGVPLWLYIFYLMYDYFAKRVGAVPEFFGYLALVLPALVWAAMFSPFGGRMGWGFMLAVLMVNRAMDRDRRRFSSISPVWRG